MFNGWIRDVNQIQINNNNNNASNLNQIDLEFKWCLTIIIIKKDATSINHHTENSSRWRP
jgi:hypothetical protein